MHVLIRIIEPATRIAKCVVPEKCPAHAGQKGPQKWGDARLGSVAGTNRSAARTRSNQWTSSGPHSQPKQNLMQPEHASTPTIRGIAIRAALEEPSIARMGKLDLKTNLARHSRTRRFRNIGEKLRKKRRPQEGNFEEILAIRSPSQRQGPARSIATSAAPRTRHERGTKDRRNRETQGWTPPLMS